MQLNPMAKHSVMDCGLLWGIEEFYSTIEQGQAIESPAPAA